jgi:isopentenyl diphosphate isomerase/L-lactate dehydrogenase-like FMN-dependent dehydrogenase
MIIASIDDYRRRCKARLPHFLYDYISGGSYQENTLRANMADLQATLLRRDSVYAVEHGCAMCTKSRKRPALLLGSNSTCSRIVVSSKA